MHSLGPIALDVVVFGASAKCPKRRPPFPLTLQEREYTKHLIYHILWIGRRKAVLHNVRFFATSLSARTSAMLSVYDSRFCCAVGNVGFCIGNWKGRRSLSPAQSPQTHQTWTTSTSCASSSDAPFTGRHWHGRTGYRWSICGLIGNNFLVSPR